MLFQMTAFRRMTHCSVFALGLCLALPVLTGCDLTENHLKMDRSANMEFQDFRDGLAPRMSQAGDEARVAGADDEIPELQPYVAQPSDNLKPMPLVSISVNQTVPLRDALFELAEQAQYDVELDPRISGSIIFTARERPFDLVIQRIAEIAGLRYRFEDDILRVELDTPYNKVYKIDYLAYVRTSTSSIRNDIAVVTGQGTNTGSGFEAKGESEANFWGELSTNLEQILGVAASTGTMRTQADPQITATDQNPAPVEPVIVDGAPAADGSPTAPTVQVQAPEAVLQVTSLPTDPLADPNAAPGTPGAGGPPAASFSVNRQGGMVSIYGTDRQHREVQDYLDQLKRSVTAQVLIEAKILEVSLSDEFATGIDWGDLSLTGEGTLDINLPMQPVVGDALNPVNTAVQLALGSGDVRNVINAISRFGTVRALASPRLTVLNNQSAVLNVAENLVYFEIDIDVTRDEFGTQTEVDSDIRNVPEGVLINVQPSINLEDKSISMAVRPTITNVEDFENDPAVAFAAASVGAAAAGIVSQVPVVNVQEFDSVISMSSGQAVVMGGLLKDRTRSTQQGVPVLQEVPILGDLFRSQSDQVEKTELVVFLKATILDGSGNIHQTDKDLYRTFAGDRRPLDM